MSQSDLTWPGSQSLSVSRTVIIEALRALASNSSGASAPTTTFAFQFWYDETANALKMRNAANTAWITLFTFDQSAGTWAVSGDLVLPEKIVHAGDPDTWISLTTDTITLRTAGTNRLTVGSTGTVTVPGAVSAGTFNATSVSGGGFQGIAADTQAEPSFTWTGDLDTGIFRPGSNALAVTTGGAERLRVTSAGRVGIGTTSPVSPLHVVGDAQVDGALTIATSIIHEGDTNTRIGFGTAGDIIFFETNGSERLRITDIGRVGINTTSPQHRLDVDGDARITGEIRSIGTFNNTTANAASLTVFSGSGLFARSTSSKRSKAHIETADLSHSQAAVYGVRPVWYRSLCEADNPAWSWWGFIAEEVAEIDPRLVQWGQDADGNPQAEGVAYDRFVPHLCAVVTEQRDMIAALEARIAALEGKG
jgi:hypothetical protein